MYLFCCSVYFFFGFFYVFLCCFMFFVLLYVFFVLFYVFCVVLCVFCFVSFSVLFVCICVLNYCHWVATQLQLNISYRIFYVNLKIRRSEFLAEVAMKISGFCHLILVINILTSVGTYCQLRHLQKIIKFEFILPYRNFNFDLKFVPEIAWNIIISKDISRCILIMICLLFADSMHGFSVWFSLRFCT
jgi:hypothetical protein